MANQLATHWSSEKTVYDGSQLASLYTYLNYGVEGDSALVWIGPCRVSMDHMVDGEDRRMNSSICGDEMLHVIVELFHWSIHGAVAFQRLMGGLATQLISELSQGATPPIIQRVGDDLFFEGGKLNISIATRCSLSCLIHFGINVSNNGTPVKTSCLNDFSIDKEEFAQEFIQRIAGEFNSIERATRKVLSF